MANFPGPFELRFFYQTTAGTVIRQHTHRVSLILEDELTPGLPFEDYNVLLKNGTPSDLKASVDAYFDLMQEVFNTTTDFPLVEMWKYTVGTFEAQFWAAYALAGVGANATATVVDSETILTFRSSLGGVMRLQYEEVVFAPAITQSFPTSVASVNAIAAFLVAATGPFIARDQGYPVAAFHYLPGSNEKFFKDRLRP